MQLPPEHADSLGCTFFLSCDDHSRLCLESCAHESELTEDGRSCLLLVPSWDAAGMSPTPPYFIVYLGFYVLPTSASGHPERSGGLATASRAETSVAGEQVATSTPTQIPEEQHCRGLAAVRGAAALSHLLLVLTRPISFKNFF